MRKTAHFYVIFLLILICFSANAQWENTGVEGGFHISLGVSPVNPDFVLAGGDIKGGIYRTIDAGANWEYAGQQMFQFLCFAFHPVNQDIAFAGSSGGLFMSADMGLTWNRIAFADTIVFSIKYNPLDPNVIYIGTGSQAWDGSGYGVFKSTDGGVNFSCVGLAPNLITELIVSPDDTSQILASCGSGVFLSNDSGANWVLKGPSKDLVFGLPTSAIAWNGGDTMYACSFYQPGDYYKEGTIFRSTDGGTTWDSLYAFLSSIEVIRTDPDDPDIVYAGVFESFTHEPGVWKSTNAGSTWQYKSNGITDRMLKDIAVDPGNPSVLYTTGDGGGGVYKTTDAGENWSDINNGMTYYIGYQIKYFEVNTEDYIYTLNSLGVYSEIPQLARMNIQSGVWEYSGIMSLDTSLYDQTMISLYDIAMDPVNNSLMYSGGMAHSGSIHNYPMQGIFFASADEGMNWSQPVYFNSRLVNSIEVIYNGAQQIILAGTGGVFTDSLYGVWRSFDGGLTFTQSTGWYPGVQVMDVEKDPYSSTRIFAATTIGMFISNDYGSSWALSPAWNIDSLKLTYRVLTDPNTNGKLFTANGGWLVNTDTTEYGGISWSTDGWNTRLNGGLDHRNVTGLALCGNYLFAGIGGQYVITSKDTIPGRGVWYADVNQPVLSWQPLDTAGMERKFVLSLACHDSIIYAGTLGGGVWKYDVSQLVTKVRESHEKMNNQQVSVWPNPSGDQFTIMLDASEFAPGVKAEISIYDVTGKNILKIERTADDLIKGIRWNPGNCPEGIYTLKITVNGNCFTEKLVWLKQ